MQRWLKRTLFGVFGASILVGGLAACSHGRHGGWQTSEVDATQMRERVLERAGKELQLDDAQKQRLAVLAEKIHDERKALMGADTDPGAEFQALVAGPKFDREHALAMVEAKTGVLRSKTPDVIAAAADFFDSLKPEQQQKVREFINKHHGEKHRG